MKVSHTTVWDFSSQNHWFNAFSFCFYHVPTCVQDHGTTEMKDSHPSSGQADTLSLHPTHRKIRAVNSRASEGHKPRGPSIWLQLCFSFFLKLKITRGSLSCDQVTFVHHWFPGVSQSQGPSRASLPADPGGVAPGTWMSCGGQSSPCNGTDRGPPHGHRSAEALRPLLEGWAAAGKTPARGGLGEGTPLVPVSPQSPQSHDWEPSMFFRDLPSFCS